MRYPLLLSVVAIAVLALPSSTRMGAFGFFLNAKVPRPLSLHCDVKPGRRFVVTLDAQAKLVHFHGGPTVEISGLKREGASLHIQGHSTSYYFMLTLDEAPKLTFGEADSEMQIAPCHPAYPAPRE